MTHANPRADVRVVLADDHPVVRQGLRALLGSLDSVTVIGGAATGREAVRQAVILRPVFGSAIAARALDRLAQPAPSPRRAFPELTPRERQILDLVAAGLSNASIASHLGMSVKTVGNHLSSIFAKLRVSRRSESIVIARDAGLGKPAPDFRAR